MSMTEWKAENWANRAATADTKPENPVSAISLLAPFVVHTCTSHSNLYEKPSNSASLCLEEKPIEHDT